MLMKPLLFSSLIFSVMFSFILKHIYLYTFFFNYSLLQVIDFESLSRLSSLFHLVIQIVVMFYYYLFDCIISFLLLT